MPREQVYSGLTADEAQRVARAYELACELAHRAPRGDDLARCLEWADGVRLDSLDLADVLAGRRLIAWVGGADGTPHTPLTPEGERHVETIVAKHGDLRGGAEP